MKVNGIDVKVQIDFGTLEILYNEKQFDYISMSRKMYKEMQDDGLDEAEISKKYNNLEMTRFFIYAGAKRWAEANGQSCPITEDDIRKMSVMEFIQAEVEVGALIMDLNAVEATNETPSKNAKSRD